MWTSVMFDKPPVVMIVAFLPACETIVWLLYILYTQINGYQATLYLPSAEIKINFII